MGYGRAIGTIMFTLGLAPIVGDRLLGYFEAADSAAKLVFTDHIGMPMLVVDGTGANVWSARAEPYGQLRDPSDKAFDPGLRYPGQWQDWLELEATCDEFDMCTLPTPTQESFSLFENGHRWYRDFGRYTSSDPLYVSGGKAPFHYAANSPFASTDPLGLISRRPPPDERARCYPTPEMTGCLETLFESNTASIHDIEIIVDPRYVELHGAVATTRPGQIYVKSCTDFFEDSCTMLEEYYHVAVQWAGSMTRAGYLWSWATRGFEYDKIPYEIDAKNFASLYSDWFSDCAGLKCDSYINEYETIYSCGPVYY